MSDAELSGVGASHTISDPPLRVASAADELRLARGSGMDYLGTIFRQGLHYVLLIALSRSLGPSAAGVIVLGQTVASLVGVLTLLGLDRSLVRYLAIYAGRGDRAAIRGTARTSLLIVGGLSLATSCLAFIGARWLANRVFGEPELTAVLRIMAFSIPFYSLMLLADSASQAHKIMRYTVVVERLWWPAAQLVLTCLALWLGLHLVGVSWAYVIALASASLLAFILMLRVVPVFERGSASVDLGALLRFGSPLFLMNFVDYAMVQAETLLLGMLSSAEDVVIYYAAWRTSVMGGGLLLAAIGRMFAPFVSDLHHSGHTERLADLFRVVTRWGMTVSLPILTGLALFSQPIMRIFGEGFAEGRTALCMLVLGQMVLIGAGPVEMMITMSGRSGLSLFNSVVLVVTRVALSVVLIPRLNLLGAAIAVVGSNLLVSVLRLVQVRVLRGMQPYHGSMVKPLIAVGLAGAAAVVTGGLAPVAGVLPLVARVLGFFAVYVVCMLGLGLEQEEADLLKALRRVLAGMSNRLVRRIVR